MSCGQLPREDHIGRLCPKRGVDGHKILPEAFELRPKSGEKELSVNWLEKHGGGGIPQNVEQVRERMISKDILEPHKKSRFAVLHVGETLEEFTDYDEYAISVLHEETKKDDSHSLVSGYTNEDRIVLNVLADLARRRESYPGPPGR